MVSSNFHKSSALFLKECIESYLAIILPARGASTESAVLIYDKIKITVFLEKLVVSLKIAVLKF